MADVPPSVQRHGMFKLELDQEDEDFYRAELEMTPEQREERGRRLAAYMKAKFGNGSGDAGKAEQKPAGRVPGLARRRPSRQDAEE